MRTTVTIMNQTHQSQMLTAIEKKLFNPHDPEFSADPYSVYHALRTYAPIHYRVKQSDWLFTRYADMVMLLRDKRFGFPVQSTKLHSDCPMRLTPLQQLRYKSKKLLTLWLNVRNPPAHTRLRNLVRGGFSAEAVRILRPTIQAITEHLINQKQMTGRMDIVRHLAHPLPLMVICDILGLPPEAHHPLMECSSHLAKGIEINRTPLANERGLFAIAALSEYFKKRIAEEQNPLTPNLLSRLLAAHREEKLSADELIANCILLLLSGHETTRHLISSSILLLLQHPEQLQMLKKNPMLIRGALEEVLRYHSPFQVLERTALEDVDFESKVITKGERVLLLLGAANRDPAQFANPDRFDITRQPNRHLSFGLGIHHCLGARLARLQAQIVLETLLKRFSSIDLQTNDVEWHGVRFRGLKSLFIVFS